MCGIVGYVGKKKAIPILLNSLKALEYRGYDSAGIAYIKDHDIHIIKKQGKIKNLEQSLSINEDNHIGIGHTRWATHGIPNEVNAHPHKVGMITLVHNGIIENYESLRQDLTQDSYTFKSETDTEVVAALIDQMYQKNHDMLQTLNEVTKKLEGTYAFGILCDEHPDTIYAIRKDSPLIIGVQDEDYFIASDVPAILNYTKEYYLLEQGEIAILNDTCTFYVEGKEIKKKLKNFEGDSSSVSKSGYEHFMMKEMMEEPDVLRKTVHHMKEETFTFKDYQSIDIVACGSAYHTGLVGKYLIEQYADIPVNVEVASEYRYKKFFPKKNHLVIVISQSGETADTLAALKRAKEYSLDTLGIVNVKESSIAREADQVIYTMAGPEIAVATTKAYLAQVTTLSLLALKTAYEKDLMTKEEYEEILHSFDVGAVKVGKLLNKDYSEQAKQIYEKTDLFYLGRGLDYALAMEGSLKLKEISYLHSEAYASGELKHGTISLVEDGTPVITVMIDDHIRSKSISNNKEVRARGGYVIAISNTDLPSDSYDDLILVPHINDFVNPMMALIPMQMISYYVAKARGCDIDKPKNLAKSVTVE
ncbi:MAG TPA: glutamine--fructose-6-phosphate transaminase (isomerizing) [Candidatus Pelethosoma merdigallinarum]|nr:glutamine--fructose-6-phosphate transaminase (isomerizing) [Candidatus Pelethosoma merdigallinarum]